MRGKGNQDPCELNYDAGLGSGCAPGIGQGRCTAGLAGWKQADSSGSLLTGMEEEVFARWIASYRHRERW